VPPELQQIFKVKQYKKKAGKHFAEDDKNQAMDFRAMIENELKQNTKLLNMGDAGSDLDSESAPSDDNLAPTELMKALPVADKSIKQKLKGNTTQNTTEKKKPP